MDTERIEGRQGITLINDLSFPRRRLPVFPSGWLSHTHTYTVTTVNTIMPNEPPSSYGLHIKSAYGVRNTHYHNTLKLHRTIFIAFKIATAHSSLWWEMLLYKRGFLWFKAILENTACVNWNASYYSFHPWKISQWSYWRSKSCGMWRCVLWWVVPDVSEGNISLIFIEHLLFDRGDEGAVIFRNVGKYSANDTASQSGRPPSPNQAITRGFKGRPTRQGRPQMLLYTVAAQPQSKAGCSLTVEMRRSVCPVLVQVASFTVTNPV